MTPTRNFLAATAAFSTAVMFSAAASATVFAIDYHDQGVWNAYDTDNETYGMKYRSDQGKDGFWLVVTNGDNPKGDGSSHAILYGDVANNKITAYTYTGENNAESYKTGKLLGTYEGAFQSGGKHPTLGYDMTMFNLDVAELNGALGTEFDGVALGEKAGIWFHQSAGSEFEYGADGSITKYAFDSQMYLDRGNDATRERGTISCLGGVASTTVAAGVNQLPAYLNPCNATELASVTVNTNGATNGVGGTSTSSGGSGSSGGGSVPAPGGLALIFAGLAGFGIMRRRKKA